MLWEEIKNIKDFNLYLKYCPNEELVDLAYEYVAVNNMAYIPESFRIRHLMDLPEEQNNLNRQVQILLAISNECTHRFTEMFIT